MLFLYLGDRVAQSCVALFLQWREREILMISVNYKVIVFCFLQLVVPLFECQFYSQEFSVTIIASLLA